MKSQNLKQSPRRRTFRAALLLLVLGSLILTVGTVGLVAFFSSLQTMDQLRARQYSIMTEVMSREVENLLGQAPPLLMSQVAMAKQGLLPVNNPAHLAFVFAETLRSRPHLTWLSYGAASDGDFVGARRARDGNVLAHFSNPAMDEGRGREFIVESDGSWSPFALQDPPTFDARKRQWFLDATKTNSLVWSPVYRFFEGTMGLTASLALREADGTLRGVFTADYSLESIDDFLVEMAQTRTSLLAIASADGTFIGRGTSLPADIEEVTNAALERIGIPLASISEGHPQPFRFEAGGQRMIGIAVRVEPLPNFACILITAVGEREFFGPVMDNALATMAIGAFALVVSSLIAFFIAARLGRPLADISEDLARVSEFQLDRLEKPRSSLAEIAQLHQSVETMKTGLRAFRRYVPTQLVRRLLELGQDAELGGTEKELTILFSDLANFTKISENLRPREIVEEMREYFECATGAVEAQKGTLDKFLGDGVLAFYNAPVDLPDHAIRACSTALAICGGLADGEAARRSLGRPILQSRIGLHTGVVLVGNIGTLDRFTYTVIGDSANLAARLESLNKLYGTSILASQATRKATGDHFIWRMLDRVSVVGRESETTIYELLGDSSSVGSPARALTAAYEQALETYFRGEFETAAAEFQKLLSEYPDDGPSALLLDRCRRLMAKPPTNWTGVFVSSIK